MLTFVYFSDLRLVRNDITGVYTCLCRAILQGKVSISGKPEAKLAVPDNTVIENKVRERGVKICYRRSWLCALDSELNVLDKFDMQEINGAEDF